MSKEQQSEHGPVSKAVPKLSARRQAEGEARYTGDVALGSQRLYAALAVTSRARVKVAKVNREDALASPGVLRVLTAEDIPGENACGGWWAEEILATTSK